VVRLLLLVFAWFLSFYIRLALALDFFGFVYIAMRQDVARLHP
jgi:hypothetical protein